MCCGKGHYQGSQCIHSCIQETKLSEIFFVKFNNIAPPRYTNYSILLANRSRGEPSLHDHQPIPLTQPTP
jgi:hypothetical protein